MTVDIYNDNVQNGGWLNMMNTMDNAEMSSTKGMSSWDLFDSNLSE
jgi:hypothetical protein